jgi:hypothetical protein
MLKKFKRGTWAAMGIAGFLTVGAFAFFVGSFTADGSHEGTVGEGGTGTKTLPVTLNWEDAKLTPTNSVPLTATLSNTSKKQVVFHRVEAIFTTTAPGCKPEWFAVKSNSERWNEKFNVAHETGEFKYAVGTHTIGEEVGVEASMIPTFTVAMVEPEGPVDQSACEGAPLKLEMKFSE